MAVTIQDDMLLAASQMSKKDGDAFLLALLAYGATGAEPKGKPTWLPTFTTCKERIDMSEARRKLSQDLNEAKRKKKTARNDRTEAPHGDTARNDRTDAPEMSRDEMSSVAVRSEETHTRAQEWCMEKPTEGFRVLDNRDKGHPKPSESLLATYASVHGSNAGFERVVRAMGRPACEGCDRSEERIIACHNTTRDALVKWDKPLDGDPARIVGKLLREDVDNYG